MKQDSTLVMCRPPRARNRNEGCRPRTVDRMDYRTETVVRKKYGSCHWPGMRHKQCGRHSACHLLAKPAVTPSGRTYVPVGAVLVRLAALPALIVVIIEVLVLVLVFVPMICLQYRRAKPYCRHRA